MYENNLGPYKEAEYRSQVMENMEKTANNCCNRLDIEERISKYNIRLRNNFNKLNVENTEDN